MIPFCFLLSLLFLSLFLERGVVNDICIMSPQIGIFTFENLIDELIYWLMIIIYQLNY